MIMQNGKPWRPDTHSIIDTVGKRASRMASWRGTGGRAAPGLARGSWEGTTGSGGGGSARCFRGLAPRRATSCVPRRQDIGPGSARRIAFHIAPAPLAVDVAVPGDDRAWELSGGQYTHSPLSLQIRPLSCPRSRCQKPSPQTTSNFPGPLADRKECSTPPGHASVETTQIYTRVSIWAPERNSAAVLPAGAC